MQTQLELVSIFFSFLTMIGTLILFVATRAEKLSTTEQVRLFRKVQRETRLIDTISEDIKILREIAYVIELFQDSKDVELRFEYKLRLEQLASTLIHLSWRSGPFTDDIARVAQSVNLIALGTYPSQRRSNVVAATDKLSNELADWLKGILSEEISRPHDEPQ